ncbi:MAG: hypothetical protein FWC57_04985, partial [Endomicrobia bacterium]|nr:hypothetical protein [Endomicrobiia bacterium]
MIKLKGKIKDYLETYWRRGRFLKGVSLIVLACFMLNIISPALARAEGTTQDLKEKQDTVKQQMASGSVSGGGATGPVNQQINVGDLGGAVKLSQEDKIAMSKQAITVTEQGNVMKKDSAQPIAVVDLKSRQVIAVIGNNGQLIDKDKNKDKFEKQKEDVQARVDQFFGKGGQPGGQYKDTVGKEYMTESKATDSRTENRQDVKDAAAGTKKTENTAQKDKKQANNEGTPKDIDADKTTGKKIEETVKQDKTELAKNRQVNEESQDEKKSKLQAAVKKNPKDENSASEVTIAMVQSSASNLAGLQLIAVRDNDDNKEKAKISLYTSELTGDNIFVGKSGGQMSYASRSGSIDVTDASDVINMEGNTYKDTGISLVEGEEKDQDAGINKNLKGLFSGEQLRVFAGRLDGVAPEAISASGEEAVFNDAKLSANKIMENMDLSGEDKKAVAVAENMDELKAAVNNIKAERKGVAFKVLLLSVIAKEENKGKAEFAAGVEKDMVLAQAKDEMFEAVDGKGFKGAGARFVAALSLSGTSLTAKERAAILKAGSTEQLKTIAGKYANMKGFIGKAIAAKLNAIAEKAEAAGNAAGGEAKSGAQADGEYDPATVNALMNQTGLSRDEVIKNFDKTKEECKKIDAENGLPEGTTFNKEMAVLKEYLAKGGSILNCASDALKNVLSGVSEGLLALQALCAEMSIGNFNEQSLTSGISAAAVMIVENQHGIQSAGYSVKTDDFVKGMNAGDKAIVWVNANHYVTVIKNEDGTLSVLDPNKNNGKALTYSG